MFCPLTRYRKLTRVSLQFEIPKGLPAGSEANGRCGSAEHLPGGRVAVSDEVTLCRLQAHITSSSMCENTEKRKIIEIQT